MFLPKKCSIHVPGGSWVRTRISSHGSPKVERKTKVREENTMWFSAVQVSSFVFSQVPKKGSDQTPKLERCVESSQNSSKNNLEKMFCIFFVIIFWNFFRNILRISRTLVFGPSFFSELWENQKRKLQLGKGRFRTFFSNFCFSSACGLLWLEIRVLTLGKGYNVKRLRDHG